MLTYLLRCWPSGAYLLLWATQRSNGRHMTQFTVCIIHIETQRQQIHIHAAPLSTKAYALSHSPFVFPPLSLSPLPEVMTLSYVTVSQHHPE